MSLYCLLGDRKGFPPVISSIRRTTEHLFWDTALPEVTADK